MSWPGPAADLEGPLAGVRVLDFSRILAGPFATMILGDLGADVIKVERPDGGDETRRWGPPFVGDTAAYFYTANRNRRSLTLDLKDADDRAVAQALARDADVVVENFLPGATERLGIDRPRLTRENPRLIYCTIAGYGTGSGRASWPALDFVIQAHSGIVGLTGSSEGEAVKAGVPIADIATGLFAAIGILAGLQQARATGEGRHVEVALADAAVALLANQAMNCLLGGLRPTRAGNEHPNLAPYQTISASDRLVALAATSDGQFGRLCEVLGCPELAGDPRFATNAQRVAHRDQLVAALRDRLATDDAATWVARLNEAGVAAATINDVAEVLGDNDVAARLLVTVQDGDGEITQVRTPIRLDGRPLAVRSAPPALGADSAEIRRALAEVDVPLGSTPQ